MKYSKQPILILYHALIILTPLIFYTKTSELFEFNKMLTVYTLTILIMAIWAAKIILAKKIIFKRTILDIPILIFLLSLLLTSLISIEPRASFLGYYSRFHGGFLSYLSYSLLYWAFVSNIDKKHIPGLLRSTVAVATLTSFFAILEHFNISPSCLFISGELNTDCWVQDVQARPFATLGQPNWLAAWLATTLPLTFVVLKKGTTKHPLLQAIPTLTIFSAILFTKSRSGLLGAATAFTLYWALTTTKHKNISKNFLVATSFLLLATILIGTPWTPSTSELFKKTPQPQIQTENQEATTIQFEGTDSTQIRKIVWKGAFDLWKKYPLLGTGVETFANSYYLTRPKEHNLTSEWNFLYNRAHNEYLNFLSTTGAVGAAAYAVLLISITYSIYSKKNTLSIALFAGFSSILVTNFFGFSVVPIGILTFLFPALAHSQTQKKIKYKKANHLQIAGLVLVLLTATYLLLTVYKYWKADIYYAKAKSYNSAQIHELAIPFLERALLLSPNEPLYHATLAQANADLAASLISKNQSEDLKESTQNAILHSEIATKLATRNVKILKMQANTYSTLLPISQDLAKNTLETIDTLETLAPTDASVYYRKALIQTQIGQTNQAIKTLEKTVELKSNYEKARVLLAIIYKENNQNEKAKQQYEYILTNINPQNEIAQENLEQLQKN